MKLDNLLKTQLKSDKINHAYLVVGKIEKDAIIKLLEVKSPDVLLIEETPIKITTIRQINHWVMLKPHSSKYKLVIIKNFDSINLEAGNTLLKILEEPPLNTIFILQAEKIEKVLPTIQSRCQIIKEKYQTSIAADDYLSIEELSKMSVRERFSYAENISISPNLMNILKNWEEELRNKLKNSQDVIGTLNDIEMARSLLSTNTSVKLLIENILLSL